MLLCFKANHKCLYEMSHCAPPSQEAGKYLLCYCRLKKKTVVLWVKNSQRSFCSKLSCSYYCEKFKQFPVRLLSMKTEKYFKLNDNKICYVSSAICPFLFVQSFKGFDDPLAEFETTFQEVVKRLRQKFRYLHVLPSHEQN